MNIRPKAISVFLLALICVAAHPAPAQQAPAKEPQPWMNASLTPEQRAQMVLEQMTLDEKITLLHGEGMIYRPDASPEMKAIRPLSNGGVGLVLTPQRLGIPLIQMSDAAYGVRQSADNGRYSTALPSNVASAASWDVDAACAYGTLIGKELRAQGYTMSLGGGTNITRDPRNGRTFEYMGEDPVLAGTMVGQRIRCEGAQHVISDIKHYAVNDQESGRQEVNSVIGERALRESDLLAFEIGVKTGHPNAVMCSYNGINGAYACENSYLLTDVLKKEWAFPGFVVSDWDATHSTEKASAAGLDMEQPEAGFYGDSLKTAVQAGRVPMAQLDDHVRRVLAGEFASGVVDDPPRKSVVDAQGGFDVARRIAEQSSVLLRNEKAMLPLDAAKLKSIAVIGLHADTGMISGGGSAQVDAPGDKAGGYWKRQVWFPTSPLAALQAKAPTAQMSFASGENIADAVAKAKAAEIAVVFAWQWESEDMDLSSLSLPEGQDALIAAVAAVNPRTIVVLETGTAVTMPWLQQTRAVLESWYAGSKGADAVANLLFGDVSPSGKLPMTFPASEADLPRTVVAKPAADAKNGTLSFDVKYTEGVKVGYKWYEAEHKPVLFPFGFGLSYTSFRYSGLRVAEDGLSVSVTVQNTGARTGSEVAEVYAALPESAGEPKRLVGWQKVELAPGASKTLQIAIDAKYLSIWDVAKKAWMRPSGTYRMMVGGSSADLPLQTTVAVR